MVFEKKCGTSKASNAAVESTPGLNFYPTKLAALILRRVIYACNSLSSNMSRHVVVWTSLSSYPRCSKVDAIIDQSATCSVCPKTLDTSSWPCQCNFFTIKNFADTRATNIFHKKTQTNLVHYQLSHIASTLQVCFYEKTASQRFVLSQGKETNELHCRSSCFGLFSTIETISHICYL